MAQHRQSRPIALFCAAGTILAAMAAAPSLYSGEVQGVNMDKLSYDLSSPILNGVTKEQLAARAAHEREIANKNRLTPEEREQRRQTRSAASSAESSPDFRDLTSRENTVHRLGKFLANQAKMRKTDQQGAGVTRGRRITRGVAADANYPNVLTLTTAGADSGLVYDDGFDLSESSVLFTPRKTGDGEWETGAKLGYDMELDSTRWSLEPNSRISEIMYIDEPDVDPINLRMTGFKYFGIDVSRVYVHKDGYIDIQKTQSATFSDNTPSELEFIRWPRIAVFWGNLDPYTYMDDDIPNTTDDTTDIIRYTNSDDKLVIEWIDIDTDDYDYYYYYGYFTVNAKVTLFKDGRILLTYGDIESEVAALVGISYGDQTPGTPSPGDPPSSLPVFPRDLDYGEYSDLSGSIYERFIFDNNYYSRQTPDIDVLGCAKAVLDHFKDTTFKDKFDAIVVYPDFTTQTSGSFYFPLFNDVDGIEHPMGKDYDLTGLVGSSGKLHGVVHMGRIDLYGGSGDTPLANSTFSHNGILARELMHRYGAFIDVQQKLLGGSNNRLSFPGDRDFSNWSFFFHNPSMNGLDDSFASVLGGNVIEPTASGYRTVTVESRGFSKLDLYLMGFLTRADLTEKMWVIDPDEVSTDPVRSVSSPPDRVTTMTETGSAGDAKVEFTIDDLITKAGSRVPNRAPTTEFQGVMVIVTKASAAPAAADILQVDDYRTSFEEYFIDETTYNGRNMTYSFSIDGSTPTGGGGTGGSGSGSGGGMSPGTSAKNQSNCCVATVLLGGKMGTGLFTLRSVRDELLRTSQPGQAVSDLYYSQSPVLARQVAKSQALKAIGRRLLNQSAVRPLEVVMRGLAPAKTYAAVSRPRGEM